MDNTVIAPEAIRIAVSGIDAYDTKQDRHRLFVASLIGVVRTDCGDDLADELAILMMMPHLTKAAREAFNEAA